ncbi:MAG: DUF983 domain-containing protein [Niastella sp.]|nr:DUF983 domain-containing protein [Niastella sp.]
MIVKENAGVATKKPGYLWSLLNHKCARCRRGDMFQSASSYSLQRFMKMNECCPVCDQRMEIEVGFYYGTGYVSYALTVALSVTTFVAWWVLIGLSTHDNRFFWWLGTNITLLILLQPYLMRLSRAIWLSFFVKYDPDWFAKIKDDGIHKAD